MNAPLFCLRPPVPTIERIEFKQAMAVASTMGDKPTSRQVRVWAELMKRALNESVDRC